MPRLIPAMASAAAAGAAVSSLLFLSQGGGPAEPARPRAAPAPRLKPLPVAATPTPYVMLRARPLLSPATGGTETQVTLSGVVLRPVPRALLSVAGAPARWLAVGETAGDVELAEVAADQVRLDTSSGLVTVKLGRTRSPAPDQATVGPPPR